MLLKNKTITFISLHCTYIIETQKVYSGAHIYEMCTT